VIHDLVGVGGLMFHELPAGGLMTHGLFTYNPKWFWHLARENSYEVLMLKVCSHANVPIPDDVRGSNRRYGNDEPLPIDSVPSFSLRAILQKVHDAPFVTPMDLPPIIKNVGAPVHVPSVADFYPDETRRGPTDPSP
jgi:hypothetical protein